MFYTIAFVITKAMAIFEKKFVLNNDYKIIALPTCKPISLNAMW
jgi:hypothetical protein